MVCVCVWVGVGGWVGGWGWGGWGGGGGGALRSGRTDLGRSRLTKATTTSNWGRPAPCRLRTCAARVHRRRLCPAGWHAVQLAQRGHVAASVPICHYHHAAVRPQAQRQLLARGAVRTAGAAGRGGLRWRRQIERGFVAQQRGGFRGVGEEEVDALVDGCPHVGVVALRERGVGVRGEVSRVRRNRHAPPGAGAACSTRAQHVQAKTVRKRALAQCSPHLDHAGVTGSHGNHTAGTLRRRNGSRDGARRVRQLRRAGRSGGRGGGCEGACAERNKREPSPDDQAARILLSTPPIAARAGLQGGHTTAALLLLHYALPSLVPAHNALHTHCLLTSHR